MFKKLKEKITEEVKISPQRFQQLTQSVSDRLQNSSVSDENFFSIGEDDTNMSNASIEPGFSNISLTSPQEHRFRRSSNSSMASDVSFLPRYESVHNMYHLQSDLDVSASEIEDNVSITSQTGQISKEQIYAAFQKSQLRYHKYRGRYTDLAKHYKDLERENGKIRAVLVETQDKAIRRVTELKEQCSLEQKAKAHLESALRDEMDEKQLKIDSLQTQIDLLKNGADSEQSSESMNTLNKYLTDARVEIENLNTKMQELKAINIVSQTKEQEYKLKISSLEKEVSAFFDREKDNNLTLAQNKMELHNELLRKDAEISKLKQDHEVLKQNLETLNSGNLKMENLQIQNKKLIDKLESLTQKCNTNENDLLRMEQYKIELQTAHHTNSEFKTRLKEAEGRLDQVREDAKLGLLSLEGKIKEKLENEFEIKEQELKRQFESKLREVSSNEEIQAKLFEQNDKVKQLTEEKALTLDDLAVKAKQYTDLEKSHLELIEESNLLRSELTHMNKKLTGLENGKIDDALMIQQLEDNVAQLQKTEESHLDLIEKYKKLETENLDFNASVTDLSESNKEKARQLTKLNKKLEQYSASLTEAKEMNSTLEIRVAKLITDHGSQEKEVDEKYKIIEESSRAEKESLLEEISEKNTELGKLKETLDKYMVSNTEAKEDTARLEKEIRRLNNLQVEKEKTFEEKYEALITSNLHEKETWVQETAIKDKLLKEFETRNKDLTDENARSSVDLQECVKLRTDADNFAQEKEILTAKLTEIENQKSSLQVQVDELGASFNKERGYWQLQVEELSSNLNKITGELGAKNENIASLNERNINLTEQLNEYKNKDTESYNLLNKLQELNVEIEALQTTNASLELKIGNYENEIHNKEKLLEGKSESNAQLQSRVLNLEETNTVLEQNVKLAEEQLNEERQIGANLRETIKQLSSEITANKEIISNREQELSALSNNREHLKTKVEEVDLLKEQIEEAHRNGVAKEEETKKLSEELSRLLQKLGEVEDLLSEERALNNSRSEELNEKTKQIEILAKKIEEYNEEPIDEFNTILSKFGGAPLNKFSNDEGNKLRNLEEKLQYFEKKFSHEKENLTRVVVCLKDFEEKYLKTLDENGTLSRELEGVREQIQVHNSTDISINQLQDELLRVRAETQSLREENEKFKENIRELQSRNVQIVADSNFLSEENQSVVLELEESKLKNEEIKIEYNNMKLEFNQQNSEMDKLKRNFEELSESKQQLTQYEKHIEELQHEKQLLQDEIQELKTIPINVESTDATKERFVSEIERLQLKVTQYKSLDLTNKSSIEFYENELQKLKNQNEKLNRKLDETLVTLNHCAELSNSTEVEYLKNVLYNYMLGKESLVLARVIAAVCKFDPQQTETILAKEQQKQTLLGQLGIL